MLLRAREFEFVFPRPAMVMGIVNVTSDSFSDGGRFLDAKAAADHALRLVDETHFDPIAGPASRPSSDGEERLPLGPPALPATTSQTESEVANHKS